MAMKKKQQPVSPQVVTDTYETEIEFVCPVRGKVKQKVNVKRLAPGDQPPEVEEPLQTKNATVQLDSRFSGLEMSDDSLDDGRPNDNEELEFQQ
jgi:hypothetical protein